jgi:hypothetical protein
MTRVVKLYEVEFLVEAFILSGLVVLGLEARLATLSGCGVASEIVVPIPGSATAFA